MEDAAVTHVWDMLGDVLLVLGLAGIVIPVLQRVNSSPVLGCLCCGLILGP